MPSSRRCRLAHLFAIGLLGAFAVAARAQGDSTNSRPNIVYILCDDLGYGDIQALNPQRGKIATPNVDRLAAQGMSFTDCHASASVCTPSRYSILTGRYAWRTRLRSGALPPDARPLLEPGRLTVGELLRQNGYRTAAIGKWHLGMAFDKTDFSKPITDGPLQHGFDYFYGLAASLDMPLYVFIENNRFTALPSVQKEFPSFMYGTNATRGPVRRGPATPDFEAVDVLPKLTRKAVSYLHDCATDQKPFFLYLALTSPHTPVVPTEDWQGKSSIGPYGDFVMQTDWSVGQVVKALDKAGLRENTLVIFTSDNGAAPYVNIEGLEAMGHYPSAQFRGYKSDVWDGGHRLPFIVRWPGKIKPGSQSDQIVGLFDLMASCADILQVKLPDNAGEDSVSLLPAFLGTAKQPLHEAIVSHSGGDGRFSIRQGDWKLALCPGSGGWGRPTDAKARGEGLPPIQLYNLRADVGEVTNLESKNPQVVTNLLTVLKKYVADGRSTPGARQTNDVPVDIWGERSREANAPHRN